MDIAGAPSAAYNVVYVDDSMAVEYDCQKTFGVLNYCIHFMARKPQLRESSLAKLQAFVASLKLNTHRLAFHKTPQEGCW